MSRNILNLNKKIYLRNCSIHGARNYNHFLIGKVFLIICEDGVEIEIRFFKKDFIHLTGIKSDLSDDSFYDQCVLGKLSEGNIKDQQKYNWSTLKAKALRIKNIHKIIYSDIKNSLFMFNLHTNTVDFPVAIRNITIDSCVAFMGTINKARSLRKYTNSNNADEEKRIVAIFSKKEDIQEYNELVYMSNMSMLLKYNHVFVEKLSPLLKKKFEQIIKQCCV